jgi:hypothetical protein
MGVSESQLVHTSCGVRACESPPKRGLYATYVIHLLCSVASEGSEGVGITYRQEYSDSCDVFRSFRTNRLNRLDDLRERHNGLFTGVFWI